MALYPLAKKLLIAPSSSDPRQTMRAVVLHVDAGNAESLYNLFSHDDGIESHFFVKKDGTVEQYRDTAYQADAAWLSNGFAIQIETQGYGSGEWEPAQYAAIKALLLWIHSEHPDIPLAEIESDTGSGVGYHSQFHRWNLSNHSCPGPDRIKQFHSDLVPWLNSRVATPSETHVAQAKKDFEHALRLLGRGSAEVAQADDNRTVARNLTVQVDALATKLQGVLSVFPEK